MKAAEAASDQYHNAELGRHLEQCERVHPDAAKILLLRSRLARRTGDTDRATALLDRYSDFYGTDDALAFERLLTRAAAGDVDEIASALHARISEGGQRGRLAREAVISGLMRQYRTNGVQHVLGEWLDESPDDPIAQLLKGKFLEAQGGMEGAAAAYRRAIELDPDLLEARLRLALLLVSRRSGLDAAAEIEILRARLPDHPQVRVLAAKAFALQGKTAEARGELEACLRLDPDNAEALAERGAMELVAGEEAAAAADFARAIAADPGNITAHNQYALVLARTGRQADSQREYATVNQLQADVERVVEIIRGPLAKNPRDPNLLHELGTICVRAGQVREALAWFARALVADPDHLPSHRSLTDLYRQTDNPVLAARHRAQVQRLTAPTKP